MEPQRENERTRCQGQGLLVVVACRSIKPEMEVLRPRGDSVSVRYMDQNLHRAPERLQGRIQQEIDRVEGIASKIVLGYGLCSNGVVGLLAPKQGLIIPRIHDCITLFLGSRERYAAVFEKRPGTYYLTPGWIAEEKDPIGMVENDYTARVGREEAIWAVHEELKHYTHIALINTGVGDVKALRKRALENAEFLKKEYEEIPGSAEYFRKIFFGPYDDKDFVIVAPGERVQQKPFLLGT